jgi:hypothetical protein
VGKTVGTLLERREDPVAPLASDCIEGLPAMLSEPTHSSEAFSLPNSVESPVRPSWLGQPGGSSTWVLPFTDKYGALITKNQPAARLGALSTRAARACSMPKYLTKLPPNASTPRQR